MSGELIEIDGSKGEGGGQIVSSSLALSVITGKPFMMHSVRAGRKKPGLKRQHVTCVKAAAIIVFPIPPILADLFSVKCLSKDEHRQLIFRVFFVHVLIPYCSPCLPAGVSD